MNITTNKTIVKRKADGAFVVTNGIISKEINPDNPNYREISCLYESIRTGNQTKREELFSKIWNEFIEPNLSLSVEQVKETSVVKLIDFFSEFDFEPNFRFLNTLCHNNDKVGYITRYFRLVNSPYINAIIDKMNSAEFKSIIQGLDCFAPKAWVNTRFKLYYGSQGTGKTTIALEECENRCMVCHNAMLPSDLMEDFAFDDGKASFHKSALYLAMEQGQKIVLDEINLLPFESLRFLQSILDGKKEFIYKGTTVRIKDGFQIIGTMNLVVNGMTFGLPEPLVDRCMETKEFKLTAKELLPTLE